MSHAVRIAIVAAFIAALGGISTEASARGRLYPVTRCGPDLATPVVSRWSPLKRRTVSSAAAPSFAEHLNGR